VSITDGAQRSPRHLLTLWNPSYAVDAMEQHLAVLLDRARQVRDGKLSPDDRFVWWGKVRSQHRLHRAPHQDDVEALARAIESDSDDAGEVQLYLTDYRSLYVADISEIVIGDDPGDQDGAVPPYYARNGLHCDYWFVLGDIRLLVADDLPGVGHELRKLRNVYYHDKAVSLYGGMVDLPLVVTRPDGQRFFDMEERDSVTGGQLWAEWDAEQGGGVAAMERELRDNVLGEPTWQGLEPTTRRFLASGEKLFREHRGDPAFDFGPVLGAFAKALEVQCRAILRRVLPSIPVAARQANIEGRTADLLELRQLTLGQLGRVLTSEGQLARELASRLNDRSFFSGQLPPILLDLASLRNPGTHEARLARAEVQHWRNRLLGIGTEGIITRLVPA